MSKVREWYVEERKGFWLEGEVTLRSLGELAVALAFMPLNLFEKHVTGEKNDFADWVADSFEEPELAESMRSMSDQGSLGQLVSDSIEG